MTPINRKLSLFSGAFMIFAFAPIKKVSPVVIEGTVVTGKTNIPVNKAHVYILDGEEEALCNDRGEFRITTWQAFPLTLTVEHIQYETQKLKLTSPAYKQQVILKKK